MWFDREEVSYCCLWCRAPSWKTLGRRRSQSRDTLTAGSGHSPSSSPWCWWWFSSTRQHITPRKDTVGGGETHSDIRGSGLNDVTGAVSNDVMSAVSNEVMSAVSNDIMGSATGGPRAITGPQDNISGPPDYSEMVVFLLLFFFDSRHTRHGHA